jgi:glycosyltransferase involved in cell wall biosynthesis
MAKNRYNPTIKSTVSNKYSVLMSVYSKDEPQYIKESIQSILDQTVAPNEVIILVDGPVSQKITQTIKYFEKKYPSIIKVVFFQLNRGLGPVLADGVVLAKNQLVARMDSDDVADLDRCSTQLKFFRDNPSYDIIGTNVTEFIGSIDNVRAHRQMPQTHEEIVAYSKKRNPFAHPSVMFKKSTILAAGNYRNRKLCEDYDLWVRAIMAGAQCRNIQKSLLSMRTSSDFYNRRGGVAYLKSIISFKYDMFRNKYISFVDLVVSAGSSIVVSLMPARLRSWVYGKLLRSSSSRERGSHANA